MWTLCILIFFTAVRLLIQLLILVKKRPKIHRDIAQVEVVNKIAQVEVVNTVKRGKAWMEARAAEQFRAENDRKVVNKKINFPSSTFSFVLFLGEGKKRDEGAHTDCSQLPLWREQEGTRGGGCVQGPGDLCHRGDGTCGSRGKRRYCRSGGSKF